VAARAVLPAPDVPLPIPAQSDRMSHPRLALTCGDPAGVGPEIIGRWLNENPSLAAGVSVLGPERWLATLPAAVGKIAVGQPEFSAPPGQPSAEGALVAWAAMERAAQGCRAGDFEGVVTGPVSKEWLARIGYPFPGQTEFFAARWGGEPVMAFAGGRLRVALATWHVPLADVGRLLTPQLLRRTITAARDLTRADGIPAPRIGVCGLNPHAGEAGLLGRDEIDRLDPILDVLRADFPGLSSCQPGDTLFARQLKGEFDVVVALYHDQGLAPLKVIDFDQSVNITLGLPHVRTSPDHGTAFGLAGRGVANICSFANAVATANRLVRLRG
jgi:4-hydroxythreonine-4-phosphate dehydrogenase